MKDKIIHAVVWAVIVGNLAVLGMVAYWLLQPVHAPYVKEPIKVLNENKTIKVGDKIVLQVEAVKNRETATPDQYVYITCDDGNLVTLNTTNRNLPVGKYTIIYNRYSLPPKFVNSSICTFHIRNTYKLNPIKSTTVEWVSEKFTVIK